MPVMNICGERDWPHFMISLTCISLRQPYSSRMIRGVSAAYLLSAPCLYASLHDGLLNIADTTELGVENQ